MKNSINIFLIFILLLTSFKSINQSKSSEYSIDDTYIKIKLEGGTLNEEGEEINHIYKINKIKEGRYKVSITDGPGELYNIIGTDFYLTFTRYFGFSGYGQEGILIINNYGGGRYIKLNE